MTTEEQKNNFANAIAVPTYVGPGEGIRAKTGPWTFKLLGEQTGGRVSVIETYFQPGILLAPPHIHHPEDQTIIVVSGEITMEIGEETHRATAGSVLFIPKGTRHTAWGSGQETAVVIEVGAPAGFEGYIMELDQLIGEGKLDVTTMVERGKVYGLEYDLAHTQELVQKHGLKLAGM